MPAKLKPVPKFVSEAEERAYWERTDSTRHVDWSKAKPVTLKNLKPSVSARRHDDSAAPAQPLPRRGKTR
jgi:hypothetical protein